MDLNQAFGVRWAHDGWAGVLAAYNTGRPDDDAGAGKVYVDKIVRLGGLKFADWQEVVT